MKRRTFIWPILVSLLAACVPPGGPGAPVAVPEPARIAAGEVTAGARWRGTCLLDGSVRVPAGVELGIEPGTTIRFGTDASLVVAGTLIAVGDALRPILLVPDPASGTGGRWPGVAIVEGGTARFSFCRWRGAATALSVKNSSVEIADSTIEGCDKAADAVMDARLTLTRCVVRRNAVGVNAQLRSVFSAIDSTFEDDGAYAISLTNSAGGGKLAGNAFRGGLGLILNRATDILALGNTFSGCELGIAIDQVGSDIHLSGNTFEKGNIGIRILRVASPWIACCRFLGLQNGLMIERFSNPLLTNNLFDGNGTGVSAVQKCNFPIRRNVFRNNKRAIFLNMAAYAVIHENDFGGNVRDIVLGESMSSDYENRVGTGKVTRQSAEQSGSHQMATLEQERTYVGIVDARDNWWGDLTTREMEKGGADANIGSIDDAHDTPEVTYPGWAEGSYKLDRVRYDPWEKKEVTGAGPLPGGCGDLKAGEPEKKE